MEQRRDALQSAISFHKPLAALSLFLGVVALEDFVRDLDARMAEHPNLTRLFPKLAGLRSQPRVRAPDQAFRRLDTDPAGVIDPEEINAVFQKALGIAPIDPLEYWHLRDLALLRHTVAHHAALIRQIDVPRFRYFIVQPGRVINPPPTFIKAELHYLYRMGRTVERAVQAVVFRKAIDTFGPGWSKAPDASIIDLIRFFAFFGYIESTNVPVGYSEPDSQLRAQQERESDRIQTVLVSRCMADLIALYGP